MEQQHVFHGFRYGEKDQRSSLANEIVTVNSKLLKQALQNIGISSTRYSFSQYVALYDESSVITEHFKTYYVKDLYDFIFPTAMQKKLVPF